MEYYLSVKRNEVVMPVTTWMNLENTLSELSQARKDCISYDYTHMTCLEQSSSWQQKIEWWSLGTEVRQEMEDYCLLNTESLHRMTKHF